MAIEFMPSSAWEKELNNSIADADSIDLNTTYYGSIMRSNDEDWYVFTLPTAATVQLVFGNEQVKTFGENWRTTIYTSEKKKVVRRICLYVPALY